MSESPQLSFSSKKYVLERDLQIQNDHGSIGLIPKGTILYSTGINGDTPSFFMIINTKNLDILTPYVKKDGEPEDLIIPLDGYKN